MSGKPPQFTPHTGNSTNGYVSNMPMDSFLPTYRQNQEYIMPSHRKEYFLGHPVTRTADLHSNEKMLPPVWGKISKTAWEDKAHLIGGYGVRMERTKISIDAPHEFLDPHRKASEYYRATNTKPEPIYSLTRTGSAGGTRKGNVEENAHVLPGGTQLLATTQAFKESHPGRYGKSMSRKYKHDNQIMLDYPQPPRNKPPPIRWDSESARSTGSDSSRYY